MSDADILLQGISKAKQEFTGSVDPFLTHQNLHKVVVPKIPSHEALKSVYKEIENEWRNLYLKWSMDLPELSKAT